MPFPKIFQKLFTNSGAGDKLNTSLIPDTVVQTSAQSFTTAQQTQARTNLGITQDNLGGPFLPLSGGTVTGRLNLYKPSNSFSIFMYPSRSSSRGEWVQSYINNNTGVFYLEHVAQKADNSSTVVSRILFETTAYSSDPCVQVRAGTADGYSTFRFYPDARFTIANKKVYAVSNESGDTTNWYIKYTNGLIIQGGRLARGSALGASSSWTGKVSYPLAFSGTNYSVSIANDNGSASGNANGEEIGVGYKTTTSFSFGFYCRNEHSSTSNDIGISWIAIGY